MRPWIYSIIVAGLATYAGCGGPEGVPGVVKVSGTVTLDGTPVEAATVSFRPEGDARAASGRTDANGRFQLTTLNPGDGALPGSYKVSISKVEDTDPAHQITAEEMAEMMSGDKQAPKGPTRPGQKTKNVGMKYHVPQKYMDPEKSGLTATVTADGDNNFTFELN